MTPQLLELAFGREAFEPLRPYFRSVTPGSAAQVTAGSRLVVACREGIMQPPAARPAGKLRGPPLPPPPLRPRVPSPPAPSSTLARPPSSSPLPPRVPSPSCSFLHITNEAPDGPHPAVIRLSFSLPPRGDTDTLNKVCGWGCRCGAPQGREARSAQLRAWLPPGRAAGCSWRLAAAGRLLCCAAVLVPRRPSHLLRRSSWWPCCCLQTCWAATS